MRQKNDIAISATSARSYNRHWRANKLSWTAIGKIKYLYDGAIEYMDDVTLAYTHEHFNKLRTALGFKQDSELTELIEQSEAFRIVRNKETRQVVAFMSPLVRDRYVPTENQEIEEPPIPYGIFYCKANALANDNDRDKISENQRQHRSGIDSMYYWQAMCQSFMSSATQMPSTVYSTSCITCLVRKTSSIVTSESVSSTTG